MAHRTALPAFSSGIARRAGLLFDLIRGVVPGLHPLLEVADPLAEALADLGQARSAEQHDDDEEDDHQLWNAEARHGSGSFTGSLADQCSEPRTAAQAAARSETSGALSGTRARWARQRL